VKQLLAAAPASTLPTRLALSGLVVVTVVGIAQPISVYADAATKKAALLAAKASETRTLPPLLQPPTAPPAPVVSLHNVWTLEVLPVIAGKVPTPDVIDAFLRDHFTGRETDMAPALIPAVLSAAAHFKSNVIQVVSGFRSAKYNLYLHKKGHDVAVDSQHVLGHAIDFRVPGIDTWTLRQFVWSLHLGGVGYYPESEFVHCDVGRIRFWQGE
jgi:hypothetical protein